MDLRSWIFGCVVGCAIGASLGVLHSGQVAAEPSPLKPQPREGSALAEASEEPLAITTRGSDARTTLEAAARPDPVSTTAPVVPREASQQITWDPRARYRELCLNPDPRTQAWEEVAVGLTGIGAQAEATDSWWQVFRRDPKHPRAEAALRSLGPDSPARTGALGAPGELQRRIEQELQRFPKYFRERPDMERVLVPQLLEQGRSADAFRLCGLEVWLRKMQRSTKTHFGHSSRTYRWLVLIDYDPVAAEALLMRALEGGNPSREAFGLMLRLLQSQGREADVAALEARSPHSKWAWERARKQVGWPPDRRPAVEILEDDPWDGRQIHRAHSELLATARSDRARELLTQTLENSELDPAELALFIEADREHRLALLIERLHDALRGVPEDAELHEDTLHQLGDTLSILGQRGAAKRAYRHLAELYPESTPYERLRNLELGREPED